VTGSGAEQRLLGAVIEDPRQFRATEGLVSGADFEDARLGVVFNGVGNMLAMGQPVDPVTVELMFPQWDVRGLPAGVTFEWTGAEILTYAVAEYARAVRSDSVRRALRAMTVSVTERVREGAGPLDVASGVLAELQAVVDGSSSGLLRTKTLEEILAGSDAYDWVIPDLLERRDRLILTGAEGAGKTTFVRQLAVLAAAGIHPTTFQPIDPVKVLVVDAENTERQWRRAVRFTAEQAAKSGTNPAPLINIVAGNRIDITKGSHLSEIHRLVDQHKPDILFIGPLYKLVSKAINNDDDAAPLIVGLDSLRERDLALVMEAHAGKSSGSDGERDLRPRGSSALLGWPEFGMGLRHTDNAKVVQMVRWRGDRDTREGWPKFMKRGYSWPWEPAVEADAYA
jgi:signal recognition particle receptor subunit beta